MAYVCEQLLINQSDLPTCLLWVEQVTLNDMLGITTGQAFALSAAFALLIVTGAIFNKLSKIGDKSDG